MLNKVRSASSKFLDSARELTKLSTLYASKHYAPHILLDSVALHTLALLHWGASSEDPDSICKDLAKLGITRLGPRQKVSTKIVSPLIALCSYRLGNWYQLLGGVALRTLIPKNLAAGCRLVLFCVAEIGFLTFCGRTSVARPRLLFVIALCSSGLGHGYQLLGGVALNALIAMRYFGGRELDLFRVAKLGFLTFCGRPRSARPHRQVLRARRSNYLDAYDCINCSSASRCTR